MPAKIHIRTDYSDGLESRVLRQVADAMDSDNVYVSGFHRFGQSGARLLLLYFAKEDAGVPFLLKIETREKAEAEYAAVKRVQGIVQEARLAANSVFRAKDSNGKEIGALLYEHRGADSPKGAPDPKALREFLYETKMPERRLCEMLAEVFEKLANAHKKPRNKRVSVEHHYRRYLRDDGETRKGSTSRIRRVLRPRADGRYMRFLGADIYNPVRYREALRKQRNLHVHIAVVHGDLHPDNVIIDRKEVPHLIDFAWSKKNQDVLVDFVLLENSIRFMAFPRPINLADQLKVDRLLLEENGYDQIPLLEFCDKEHLEDYRRLGCAVGTIRKRARLLLKEDFSMERYLLTQFILLYGLVRYENYEPYATTRALGLIAARLKKLAAAI